MDPVPDPLLFFITQHNLALIVLLNKTNLPVK
jgi:hypothetical protein